MTVSHRHLLQQLPTAWAMGRIALKGAVSRRSSALEKEQATVRELSAERPPLGRELLQDYVRHVDGSPAAWRDDVPIHLFPQWVFPLQLRLLEGLGVPLSRALNAGARVESLAPLPAGEPMIVRAWLKRVDDRGDRAILEVASSTGTPSAPNALHAEMTLVLRRRRSKSTKPRTPHEVPEDARELGRLVIPTRAGRDFAKLTGDLNPVHWLYPYARMQGFSHVINHGFSSMARTMELLIRTEYGGEPRSLKSFECRFTKPLLLPADPLVFAKQDQVYLGDAPGAVTYLEGSHQGVAS